MNTKTLIRETPKGERVNKVASLLGFTPPDVFAKTVAEDHPDMIYTQPNGERSCFRSGRTNRQMFQVLVELCLGNSVLWVGSDGFHLNEIRRYAKLLGIDEKPLRLSHVGLRENTVVIKDHALDEGWTAKNQRRYARDPLCFEKQYAKQDQQS